MRFVVWRRQIAPADSLESWGANGLWRHRRSLGDGVRNSLRALWWLRVGNDDDLTAVWRPVRGFRNQPSLAEAGERIYFGDVSTAKQGSQLFSFLPRQAALFWFLLCCGHRQHHPDAPFTPQTLGTPYPLCATGCARPSSSRAAIHRSPQGCRSCYALVSGATRPFAPGAAA